MNLQQLNHPAVTLPIDGVALPAGDARPRADVGWDW